MFYKSSEGRKNTKIYLRLQWLSTLKFLNYKYICIAQIQFCTLYRTAILFFASCLSFMSKSIYLSMYHDLAATTSGFVYSNEEYIKRILLYWFQDNICTHNSVQYRSSMFSIPSKQFIWGVIRQLVFHKILMSFLERILQRFFSFK